MIDSIRPPASVLQNTALQAPTLPAKAIDPARPITVNEAISGDLTRRPKSEMDFVDTMKLMAAKMKHRNIMSEDEDITKEISNAIMMQMNQKAMETQRLEMLMSKLGDENIELVFTDKHNKQIVGTPSAILPGTNGMVKIVIDGETYFTQNLAGAKLVGTKIPSEHAKKEDTLDAESIPTPPAAPPPEYLSSSKPTLGEFPAAPSGEKDFKPYAAYIF